jgi:hypothetical protein
MLVPAANPNTPTGTGRRWDVSFEPSPPTRVMAPHTNGQTAPVSVSGLYFVYYACVVAFCCLGARAWTLLTEHNPNQL